MTRSPKGASRPSSRFASYDRLPSLPLESDDDYDTLVIEQADLRDVDALHVTMNDVALESVDLRGATLGHLAVRDGLLTDCDLSNARWHGASLVWVVFEGCRATGFDLTESDLRHVTFRECKLDFALLRFLHGDSVMFVDCILTGADLSGATLAGAEFERCDLVDVDLSYADLDGVDLRSSRLAPARGVGALRGAIVDAAQLGTLAPALAAEIGINVEAGDGAGSPARELRDT